MRVSALPVLGGSIVACPISEFPIPISQFQEQSAIPKIPIPTYLRVRCRSLIFFFFLHGVGFLVHSPSPFWITLCLLASFSQFSDSPLSRSFPNSQSPFPNSRSEAQFPKSQFPLRPFPFFAVHPCPASHFPISVFRDSFFFRAS